METKTDQSGQILTEVIGLMVFCALFLLLAALVARNSRAMNNKFQFHETHESRKGKNYAEKI